MTSYKYKYNKKNKKVELYDIFGNGDVKDRSPFIVISSRDPRHIRQLLTRVSDGVQVWKYDMDKIMKLVEQYRIDGSKFLPAGYIGGGCRKLLLINKSIANRPKDYKYRGKYKSGTVWTPIGPDHNDDIGLDKVLSLVFSPDSGKPKDFDIGLLHPDRLVKGSRNDMGLLNDGTVYHINRRKFHSRGAGLGYTIQGELKSSDVDSYGDDYNNNNDNDNNNNRCITKIIDDIQNKQVNYTGNIVQLVESDNPWFANKESNKESGRESNDKVKDMDIDIFSETANFAPFVSPGSRKRNRSRGNVRIHRSDIEKIESFTPTNVSTEVPNNMVTSVQTNVPADEPINKQVEDSWFSPFKSPLCWIIIIIILLLIVRYYQSY